MGSESLFTKCKTCGKVISRTAKACPKCGGKQKKPRIILWIGIVFLGLIIIGMLNTPDDPEKSTTSESSSVAANSKRNSSIETLRPQDQVRFIDAVTGYVRKFPKAKNELQQSAMRDQRKQAIASSLLGYSVTSWLGTINQLETNTEGKAILSVRISPDIEIKTWNNTLSDMNSYTLIEKGTHLYASLFELSSGQQVEFSGSFFASDRDHIKETSITIVGSMNKPEFLFRFISVKPINKGE